jgi:hypothetical protein
VALQLKANDNFQFSYAQCRDRWQYLKKRYVKKSDNMGDRGTGEEKYKFEYFEEMNEILGRKHNVKLVSIASSLKGVTPSTSASTSNVLENDADNEEPPPKKIKSCVKGKKEDVVVKFMREVTENSQRNERNKQERHEELIQCRNKAIQVFSEKMDKLIDRIGK